MAVSPRRSRAWIWWLSGGCAVLLVIGVVGAGFAIHSLTQSLQSSLKCLPSDFPSYPGAKVMSSAVDYGAAVAPGDSKLCQMKLESSDDVSTVTAFYTDRLNSGDWKVTAVIASAGQIQFHRLSRDLTKGIVDMVARGQYTEITIQLSS